jgi:hypothetical protein
MMPPAAFIAVSFSSITDDGINQFHTVLAPTSQAGDVLLFISASDFFIPSVTRVDPTRLPPGWASIGHAENVGQGLGIDVLRKTATSSEPSSYTFYFGGDGTEAWGALLVFRGLDGAAAPVGALAMAAVGGSLSFPCPGQALTTYSDLYLGISFGSPGVTFTPPAGGRELLDAQVHCLGIDRTMEVFSVQPETTGATGTQTATANSAAAGLAASIAFASLPALPAPAIMPDIPGAIGFVTVGV